MSGKPLKLDDKHDGLLGFEHKPDDGERPVPSSCSAVRTHAELWTTHDALPLSCAQIVSASSGRTWRSAFAQVRSNSKGVERAAVSQRLWPCLRASAGAGMERRVLDGVSGVVRPGELVAILGPSGLYLLPWLESCVVDNAAPRSSLGPRAGAGKTSLLNILGGRDKGGQRSGSVSGPGQSVIPLIVAFVY